MPQAQGRELEVPCGSWHSPVWGSPAKSAPWGHGAVPHWHSWCVWASGAALGCEHGCAAVAAGIMDTVQWCQPGHSCVPQQGGQSCQCTHVRGLLVLHTPPGVFVQPPQCVQRAPEGSSCPVLHVIGLTGLFSGALSACQGKGLSRHDVKLTSFKSHSALGVITNPGEALSIKHLPCRRVKKICSG